MGKSFNAKYKISQQRGYKMRRSKPELSDWIKFLISQKNIGFSITFMLISLFFIILGLIFAYENEIQPVLNNIFLVSECLLIGLIYYVILFRLLRAKKLLKKIMKGEMLDSEKIRYEWFEKKGLK